MLLSSRSLFYVSVISHDIWNSFLTQALHDLLFSFVCMYVRMSTGTIK